MPGLLLPSRAPGALPAGRSPDTSTNPANPPAARPRAAGTPAPPFRCPPRVPGRPPPGRAGPARPRVPPVPPGSVAAFRPRGRGRAGKPRPEGRSPAPGLAASTRRFPGAGSHVLPDRSPPAPLTMKAALLHRQRRRSPMPGELGGPWLPAAAPPGPARPRGPPRSAPSPGASLRLARPGLRRGDGEKPRPLIH